MNDMLDMSVSIFYEYFYEREGGSVTLYHVFQQINRYFRETQCIFIRIIKKF